MVCVIDFIIYPTRSQLCIEWIYLGFFFYSYLILCFFCKYVAVAVFLQLHLQFWSSGKCFTIWKRIIFCIYIYVLVFPGHFRHILFIHILLQCQESFSVLTKCKLYEYWSGYVDSHVFTLHSFNCINVTIFLKRLKNGVFKFNYHETTTW